MPRVSPELKTKIMEFLAEQQQPRRVWEIANGAGCSESSTRAALKLLIEEGAVERFTVPGHFNPREGLASVGFDQNPSRPGYRYRLCSSHQEPPPDTAPDCASRPAHEGDHDVLTPAHEPPCTGAGGVNAGFW